MQKINSLLDQANKKLKKDSSSSPTEVGPSKLSPSDRDRARNPDSESIDFPIDRVDAINNVFAEFEFAYHNQFHKALVIMNL